MKSSLKWILIILSIVIIIVVAYAVIASRSNTGVGAPGIGSALETQSGTFPTAAPTPSSDVEEFSNDLLVLLTSIERITLDDAIFFSPGFKALSDISIELIPEGGEGRINPFAPIGELGVGGKTSGSVDNQFSDDLDFVENTNDTSDERSDLAEDLLNSFGINPNP